MLSIWKCHINFVLSLGKNRQFLKPKFLTVIKCKFLKSLVLHEIMNFMQALGTEGLCSIVSPAFSKCFWGAGYSKVGDGLLAEGNPLIAHRVPAYRGVRGHLSQEMFVSVSRFFFGLPHSSCKYLRFYRFAAFLHSSCSVAVSYFMFIPVFVILLFLVTMFILCMVWIRVKACATIYSIEENKAEIVRRWSFRLQFEVSWLR